MKRPFGLIGLTYLTVLAVVFYFGNSVLNTVLVSVSAILLMTGIFFKVIKKKPDEHKNIKNTVIAVSSVVLCGVLSIILYTNYIYLPIVNNYSEKELKISGYISDEIRKTERSFIYLITTDRVNGNDEKIKIQLVSYNDLAVDEFEKFKATLKAYRNDSNYSKSKGIYFITYVDDVKVFEATGEYKLSLYSYAVKAREAMKYSLDSLLPETCSSLCKAVLLGDKQALPPDIKSYFTKTGTSFLIVVSGMHLAIVVGFILFLIKKITSNKYILCLSATVTVFLFMAITGFTSSVIRSGIMVIIAYCATLFFRRSDAVNSLGVAALMLTVTNPYSVGDIGMLLSFSATMGIVLWSRKITEYIVEKFKIKIKFLKACVGMVSVSLSASLWIIPITTLAFGTISPLVVITSFFTQTLVSGLLICAMLASVLYMVPFVSFTAYPFALMAGIMGKFFLWMISLFASIPFSTVNSDKIYFYIWIALSITLVMVGYIIKAKGFYIKISIALSVVTLMSGWALYTVLSYNTANVKIYDSGYGVTVGVECGYNTTLISCGGSLANQENVIAEISHDFRSIDNVIIPSQKSKHTNYLWRILEEFDVSNILVYDSNSENQKLYEEYDGKSRRTFGDNIHFTINLNNKVKDDVYNIDGVTYQYVSSERTSMLYVPAGGDVSKLPESVRTADYLLTEALPENYELLECRKVILSGDNKAFEKYNNLLKEISPIIYSTVENTFELEF